MQGQMSNCIARVPRQAWSSDGVTELVSLRDAAARGGAPFPLPYSWLLTPFTPFPCHEPVEGVNLAEN